MNVSTTRFGSIAIEEDDVLTFVDGLIGMESCRRWVLLADAQNNALAWMQCLDRPDVALAVISPRRFVADYQVRVSLRDLQPLALDEPSRAQVLVIVSQVGEQLAVNLKAPLLIHLEKRLGRQIVARDDHPVQYPLPASSRFRKTG
jgi:flagellar assembly factor FliW